MDWCTLHGTIVSPGDDHDLEVQFQCATELPSSPGSGGIVRMVSTRWMFVSHSPLCDMSLKWSIHHHDYNHILSFSFSLWHQLQSCLFLPLITTIITVLYRTITVHHSLHALNQFFGHSRFHVLWAPPNKILVALPNSGSHLQQLQNHNILLSSCKLQQKKQPQPV